MQMPKYRSLKDHVYDYIAQKIQDGTLLPNDKINEAEICKQLEISRTPTREALFQLTSDNLLDYLPRRGFTVKVFDAKEKYDYSRIIGTLDALAAVLAVDFLDANDLAALDALVVRMDRDIETMNFKGYHANQYEFHALYIRKSDNPVLIDMIASLKNSFVRQSYSSADKQRLTTVLREVNAEHRNILELLRLKDKPKLECALRHHWRIIDTEML